MNNIYKIAESMQQQAWNIINETNLIDLWSDIGATINLVGSLKTGLLINNRDIDFHLYTNPFKLADSFSVITRLAENKRIKRINYTNLLEDDDKCIEWHAFYEDQNGDSWQIDMIHILNESPYAGYFEKVAERITKVLTPETRTAILGIKNSIPPEEKIMGILVYQAVIENGVRDINAFRQWMDQHPAEGIITWIP